MSNPTVVTVKHVKGHGLPRRSVLIAALIVAALLIAGLIVGLARPFETTAKATGPSNFHLVASKTAVTDHLGQVWSPDAAYARGGTFSTTTKAIAGTVDQNLFQSQRNGMSSYQIPVAAGTYTVTVNMAEHYWTKAHQRVFDITAEGIKVESLVDIVAAVGQLHAYQLQFTVTVTDGTLNLGFVVHADQPAVTSLAIVGTAAAPPALDLTPENFGAKGNGVTDDTVALQKAFDSAQPGTPVLLAAGAVYAHTGLLYLRTAGLHVTGTGTLLATKEATSSVWIEADDVLVDGGVVFRTSPTTQRWSAWEQMGIRLFGHQGIVLRNITVDGSAAAGIYVGGQSSGFVLDHVTVENTRADGITMTQGAHDGQVIAPTVINSGDDGVSIVSYSADGAPCQDITVTLPRVLGTNWGRGLSVVGGIGITETGIDVENTDAAGVYVAAEGSPWYTAAPQNVTFNGGVILGANTDVSVDHGAVLVLAGETGPTPANVTVEDLMISGTRSTASRDFGVITYGTPPSGIVFRDFTITGGPKSAYQGNTPQSSFQTRDIIQNGIALPDQG